MTHPAPGTLRVGPRCRLHPVRRRLEKGLQHSGTREPMLAASEAVCGAEWGRVRRADDLPRGSQPLPVRDLHPAECCQHSWQHTVPKIARAGARMSVTIRHSAKARGCAPGHAAWAGPTTTVPVAERDEREQAASLSAAIAQPRLRTGRTAHSLARCLGHGL